MSSPGQKRGNCGHAMAIFDGHSFCACCRDKGNRKDPCVETPDAECKFCIVLTPELKAQLAMPSYKLKKEKREAKKVDTTVSVIGVVSDTGAMYPPPPPRQFLRRKPRKINPIPPSLRNLLRANRPQIERWRNLIRSDRTATDLCICC